MLLHEPYSCGELSIIISALIVVYHLGAPRAQVFEGNIEPENTAHIFVEKQVVAVHILDAHLLQADRFALPYTYCEVYAPADVSTNV